MDEENPLERCDRRNNTILALVGIPLFIISLLGSLSRIDPLPTMWGEFSVILVLVFLYNWAIRKKRVDLRLGLVYSAVGIVVSFVILLIGLVLSVLMINALPFLADSNFSFLALIPFGLCVLLLHQYLHRVSLMVTMKQWTRMSEEFMSITTLPLKPAVLYLAEKKWTGLSFYVFIFVFIELLPIFLRTAGPAGLGFSIFLLVLFVIELYRIFKNQKESLIHFIVNQPED